MLRFVAISAVVALTAGSASAYFSMTAPASTGQRDTSFIPLPGGTRGAAGTLVPIPVGGATGNGAVSSGDPNNTILLFDVAAAAGFASGTPVTMTGIGWDVILTAFDPSWLSESRVYFDDNIAPDLSGLFLRPGAGNNLPGTAVPFSSGGVIDLTGAGIPNIPLPNGILRLEFHETFLDPEVDPDSLYEAGSFFTITIAEQVPTPGALALAGIAGLAGLRRRR